MTARLSLAPGLTGVAVSGGGVYSAITGLVTWPVVATQATGTAQAPLTVTVNAPASGLLTGTASVTATTADPVPADNVATTEVTITNANITDINITLNGPARAIAGQSVTYVVTTTNAGFNPAADVAPSVSLPTGLSGVVVSGGGSYNSVTGVVSFPVTALLAPGSYLSNSITFNAPLNDASSLPLAAGVFTTSTELSPANNVARASTLLQAYADVEVFLSGPATSTVGSPITYVVTTNNNGPAVSNGHTLTVQLPTGLAGVTVTGGGVYNLMTGVVTFPAVVNQLPTANGAVVRTISFTTPDRSFLTPTAAIVITGGDDPTSTNNLTNFTTAIAAPTVLRANAGTTVTSNVPTQTAGSPVTFTVGTTNSGPDPATVVTQQLVLRPGLTGVVVSDGGIYNSQTGIVTWNLPDMANGGSASRTVTVNVPGVGPLVATAIASATETDLTTANNRATASVTITPSADVAIQVNGRSITEPGVLVAYSVTTINNGASPATNVAQTVQLLPGLVGVSVTGGGVYNSGTGIVTFPTIAAQPIGTAGVVTNIITFTAPAVNYVVTGTVTTATADPLMGNNTSAQATSSTINRKPIAFDVVNTLQAPRGETSTASLLLSPLNATDPDGTVASYTVLTLPNAAHGILSLGGVPVTVNQVLTPAQAALLTFDPVAGFAGNASFAYRATDNLGAVGNQALMTVPVGRDNASVYTIVLVGPYLTGNDIARVFDVNGGEYAAGPVVSDNGTRSVFLAPLSNPLPPGVALNAVTGRVYISNLGLLLPGTYTLTITTIDEFAGENTQPVIFTIDAATLPVELVRFDAKPNGRVADLTWATASERNSAWFVVERSANGRDFRALGRVAAAGTTTASHAYAWTDAAPLTGLNYYRLRLVDTDGTTENSVVRALRFEATPTPVAVWPNPFTDRLQLDLSAYAATETVILTLTDATGRRVRQVALSGGAVSTEWLGELPVGTYVARLSASAQDVPLTFRLVRE